MSKLRDSALGLLARREHSQKELRAKLKPKVTTSVELDDLLRDLVERNLQSDQRFAEAYVRSRVSAGFGPLRIVQELQQKGIDDIQSEALLSADIIDWWQVLLEAWQKKYRGLYPGNQKEFGQQFRFLMQRGFSSEMILKCLKNREI